MPTSDVACAICGETRNATRLGWGCVACNPDKERLARQPEVPFNPGWTAPEPERVGCLQHGKLDCERCGLLETRTRMAVDEYVETPAGPWVRDERGGGLGVAILFAFLMLLVAGCGYLVWTHWPR